MNNKYGIIFLEEEFPLFDRKELPWEDKNSPFHIAMKLNKDSKDGGYVHPVEVIWDEQGYQFITMTQDKTSEIIIDGNSHEFLHADLGIL